jgi:hypothetical protein
LLIYNKNGPLLLKQESGRAVSPTNVSVGLPFFDKKAEKAGPFFFPEILMTGPVAPSGNVVSGTRVGAVNLQNLAALQFTYFFFRAEQGHGTAQTLRIENGIGGYVGSNLFYITHGKPPDNDSSADGVLRPALWEIGKEKETEP